MKFSQVYIGRLWRAIIEFDMLDAHDRILVGLSGGKDSMFLTYGLSILKRHSPKPFTLAALTIDPMFTTNFALNEVAAFCRQLDVPFYTEKVNIAGIIEQQHGKDPCFSCSYFRRGAMNRFAKKNGFNKIALAHHHDDAVETFFMNLLLSGQLKTFLPTTYLSRTGLTVIRPLIYFREEELRNAAPILGYQPVKSPCPIDGHTKRQDIKLLIAELTKKNPAIYDHLTAGMRNNLIELWPQNLSREQLKQKYDHFWYDK